ncbi:MAG: NAD(+) diphosphatase [Micrococcales bacterium]|nr:NAD(+) diphosphatase [Micrococcales bacterium]
MKVLPEPIGRPALARSDLDRAAHLRADPGLVPRLLSDPTTRVVSLAGDRAECGLGADGRAGLVLRAPVPEDSGRLTLFLGFDPAEGHPAGERAAYLAVVEEPGQDDARGWATLRRVGTMLGDRDAGLFTTAVALANWHATHTHCPRCGSATIPATSGWTRLCESGGSQHFPRTDPAVICSVIDDQDRILLAQGRGWPPGRMSILAGFVEPGEALEAAVVREIEEESGLVVGEVTYLGDQPWPFPASLMLGFTARVVGGELRLQEDEIESARWFTREEFAAAIDSGELLPSSSLSIAYRIIEHWYGRPFPTTDIPVR